MKKLILFLMCVVSAVAFGIESQAVGTSPGPGIRYATDAYPGFDAEKDGVAPACKEPRWFSFYYGPKCGSAAEQMRYCHELEVEESWAKACKHYDALVREWPNSPEAPIAQQRLAELLLAKEDDAEEAFAEYRYLVDFYSFRCDYRSAVDRMYEIAEKMRNEGKSIMFFRFKNTFSVRRAYEACVLRAPGAEWAPRALLTIAALRAEDQEFEEAVKVYENLRNLHYGSAEAKRGLVEEASMRMKLLRKCGYNRDRCRDTAAFLKLAYTQVEVEDRPAIAVALAQAEARLEEEAYHAAKFYDSTMRTRASAVNAYRLYLSEYPTGAHAETVRARLTELMNTDGK